MPNKVYEIFFQKGEVVEIRALGLTGKNRAWEGYARKNDVVAGYFDNAQDFATAAQALDNAKAKGVYFTINPCNPALLARASNRLIASPKATTTDQDIKCLRWLPIDLDPERPADISSTDKELKSAYSLAKTIAQYLEGDDHRFPKGIRACSGNGYHLVYRLPDLPNDDEHRALIKRAVKAIESIFHNDKVSIDLKVVNPARIWKVYSTTGRKGDSTKDRPHRASHLLPDQASSFDEYPALSLEQLQKLGALAPAEESRAYPPAPSGTKKKAAGKTTYMKSGLGSLDVGAYLAHYGKVYTVKTTGALTLYRLDECIFDPNHKKNEASICFSPSPPFLTYQCFHNSCKDRTWKEARSVISGSDSLAPFCSNYDPDWKAPTQMGTGLLKDVQVEPVSFIITEKAAVPPPQEIDPAEFYEQRGKRAVFVPMLMAKYYSQYLSNIVHTDGQFWRYDHGVWDRFSKNVLAQICVLALKHQIQASWIDNSIKIFAGLVNQEETQWPNLPDYINCANGMVDLKQAKLIDHDPKYGSRIQIPAKFDYDAIHERWDKFLEEVFPEDKSKKQKTRGKADMLQQFFGYCLLPDCRFQKAIFLYGVGANGKSTALNTLIEIIGRENTSSLTISDLGQRFKVQFLQDKLVNIATETNTRDPIATEIFKAAIRGDPVTAERKYGEPYLFRPSAKWLVAMNESPVIPDKTYGFTRGIAVLEWKRRFEGKEIDPYLSETLAKERDGIFMWSLFGLERIIKNKGFEVPPVVEKESAEFMKTLNPVLIFIDEQCKLGPNNKVGSMQMYEEYKKWCADGGNRPLSRNRFIDQILMNCPSVRQDRIKEDDARKRGFVGIGLKATIE